MMVEIRNAVFLADGRIDCEVDHPKFGWIPYTASETDSDEDGRKVFALALSSVPAAYVAPVVDEAAVIAADRSTMRVSRLQAMAAMYNAGLLTTVEAAMGKADFMTQLAWKEAAEFRRTSPLIDSLAVSLGIADEALDDLFRAAALIEF